MGFNHIVFESIIRDCIFNHVKPIISANQYGFLPRTSTVCNLVNITEDISSALNAGKQLDVIYTDFQKAFDKVDRSILIHKLDKFGFNSEALEFLYHI